MEKCVKSHGKFGCRFMVIEIIYLSGPCEVFQVFLNFEASEKAGCDKGLQLLRVDHVYIYIWCNRYVDYIIWVFLYMIFFPMLSKSNVFFQAVDLLVPSPPAIWCTRLPTVPSPVALWHDWRRHGRCMATMPCRKPYSAVPRCRASKKGWWFLVLQMDGIFWTPKDNRFLRFFFMWVGCIKHKIW